MLAGLRGCVQHEGDAYQLPAWMRSEDPSGYETIHSQLTLSLEELPQLDDARLFERIVAMTDQLADQQMRLFLRRLDDSVSASGNIISNDGKELTEDSLLDMLDRVELDFDGDGIGSDFAFLMAPSMVDKLQSIKQTPEGAKRHAQILERQRLEWRLREADRKLVS